MNEVSFADIVSKPVGVSYEYVQTLGIYYGRTAKKREIKGKE